ncbi:hypothetical protein PIB30_049803 [Stylosanthes scabra]|uniref:Uncharacterized protein n=1 Tax=Stylosanthes scabra TaxID=79078 RepID=A0ABU6SIL0_9FABA|nr:hypothetical protein [Stylosanthes scabra]
MVEEDSFLALIHHDGEIKYKLREGVKFTDKNPTNVFITTRTRLVDLQRSILRSLVLIGGGVKCGCFAIECVEDLQVLFHYQRQFPGVRMTELFVEIVDPLASFCSSAPNPHSANVAGSSRLAIQHVTEEDQVVSPSFWFNLQEEAVDCGGDLGDSRSFGELAVTIAAAPHPISSSVVDRLPEPLVEKALRPDDSDDEPAFIEGDSDDDSGPVSTHQGGSSSLGTQQYPPYLLNLNLDALSGPRRRGGESNNGTQGSQGSSTQADFEVGQTFPSKEVDVIAVKNYNI